MKVVRAVTVGIHSPPVVRVPRHTIIVQAGDVDFPSDHRVATWGDDLGLVHTPRCVQDL